MRCRRVQDLLPLHVGADLEPEAARSVAEHLRTCFACARELRAHQEALAAFRSLRDLEPELRPPGDDAAASPPFAAGRSSSVLWSRLQPRLREERREAPVEAPIFRRASALLEYVPPRLRLAIAAAILGASLLALGFRIFGDGSGGGAGAGSSGGVDHALYQAGFELRELENAGVLDPHYPGGEDLAPNRHTLRRQVQYVGRTGPNSNY